VPSFSVTEPVDASAAKAWETVGNFGDDSWTPVTITVVGEGEGAVRTIETPTSTVVERCERLDDAAMVLGYSTVSGSSLPATNYRGTLTVRATGVDTSEIEWAATYDTDAADAMEAGLGRAFGGGLKAMRQHIERSAEIIE
jgi:hypothetical protein